MDFRRISSLQINGRSVQRLALGGRQIWSAEEDTTDYLTFTGLASTNSIALNKTGSPDPINLEYRTYAEDSGWSGWQTYAIGSVVYPEQGEKVQFRGDNTTLSKSSSAYYKFAMTGKYAASGSIMTLLDKTDTLRTLPSNAFNRLFLNCSQMTTPPKLPATTMGEACYDSTFSGCSSMTVAPELPATTLAKQCYSAMLQNCSSITKASVLPATELKELCYHSMYEGCSSLTQAPELPATTMAHYCYRYMFQNCRSLTQAPALPATTLDEQCYGYMFKGCSSLTQAPALPATTLDEQCYGYMFQGCSALTEAPELPATALVRNCYWNMFQGCTALKQIPKLPANRIEQYAYNGMFKNCTSLTSVKLLFTSFVNYGCNEMFSGCSKLNKVEVAFTNWGQAGTTNWLANVSPTGTFICSNTLPDERGANRIPENWLKTDADYLTFTAEADSSSVRLARYGNPHAISLEYRTNASPTWSAYSIGNYISLNQGGWAQFRGDNQAFTLNANNNYKFEVAGKVAASGNLMSVCDSTCQSTTIPADDMFECLFEAQSNLTKAPELPATTLTTRAYRLMFHGCTSLREAPELPATDMANYCYAGMFEGCTALTEAPYLPATELATRSYEYMFQNCTSLSLVKVAFTSWLVNNSTSYWMNNVAPTGTFICPPALPQESGVHRIPTGWTVEQNVA